MADKKSEEAKKVVSEFDKLKKSIIAKNPHVIGGKDYGKIVWCPIPSPSMTAMLGKGIPVGRMIRFRGQPSAGKSVICDYLAGCLQKECPKLFDNPLKTKILYIDFERTFEEKFATGVGVDMDNFVPITPNDIEEACDTVCDLIKTGEVAAIVFDSDGQCPSRTAMTDESGKANFGANAKAISQLLDKWIILCANYKTTLFWISQERVNMKFGAHLPSVTGGEKPAFAASIVCRATKVDDIKSADGIIGVQIKIKNYKNKCATPFRESLVNLYFDGTGFHSDEEYAKMIFDLGIVEGRNWYSVKDDNGIELFRAQGKDKIVDWLNENPDVYDKMKKKVIDMISGNCSILDDNAEAVDEMADMKMTGEELDKVASFSKEEISDLAKEAAAD